MVDSIRYVYSWQMIQTPKEPGKVNGERREGEVQTPKPHQEALTECPLGYLTAVLIKVG